jgi:hypothetical protein
MIGTQTALLHVVAGDTCTPCEITTDTEGQFDAALLIFYKL